MAEKKSLERQIVDQIAPIVIPRLIKKLHKDYGPNILLGLLRERLGYHPRNIYYCEKY